MAADIKLSDCLVVPHSQPCWDCVNAYGGCAWSREGKPVPGWEAEQTSILCYAGRQARRTESYKINFCPEFRRG